MGHKLGILPNGHPYGDQLFQCLHCGCTFDVEGANIADFMLNCDLEKELRRIDSKVRMSRPILVKDELRGDHTAFHLGTRKKR